MLKIGIIIGSTRQGRLGHTVAKWVLANLGYRPDVTFEIVDLRDYPMPHYDWDMSPMRHPIDAEHVVPWARKIAELDGFIFVTPEYNHSTTGVLKNAMDHLYTEWNNKAAAFVGYGGVGGARAIEHLRLIASELQMATVRGQVSLSTMTDFEHFSALKPSPVQLMFLEKMLDQLVAWSSALAPLRELPELA